MKALGQLLIILHGLAYGMSFSFCTLVTLGDLFYRRIRRAILFPVIAGVIFGIWEYVANMYSGIVDYLPLYVLHTVAACFLLREKNKDHLLSLICAELFSASLISGIQTALFSVFKGADRSSMQIFLLYAASGLSAVFLLLLLKQLVHSEDREPLALWQVFFLSGIVYVVTLIVSRSFTMSDYVPDVSPAAAIPSVLMLLSVTVLLLLSVKEQQAKRFRELSELSGKYLTAQAKHFEQSRDADAEMRMLRHDMKNHITVMNGLLESGRTEELQVYLKDLGAVFSDIESVNNLGNEIADAIVSEKKKAAEQMGIRLKTEGSLKGLEISAVTLCTVLSNLLDNAIEAASDTDTERLITLSARKSGSFYYLCITNPTRSSVDISSEMPTSKQNAACHGLGLKSVRNTVGKCGGVLELLCKETASGYQFTAEVILPAYTKQT